MRKTSHPGGGGGRLSLLLPRTGRIPDRISESEKRNAGGEAPLRGFLDAMEGEEAAYQGALIHGGSRALAMHADSRSSAARAVAFRLKKLIVNTRYFDPWSARRYDTIRYALVYVPLLGQVEPIVFTKLRAAIHANVHLNRWHLSEHSR